VLVLGCRRLWRLGRGERRVDGRIGVEIVEDELWEMRKGMWRVEWRSQESGSKFGKRDWWLEGWLHFMNIYPSWIKLST
jgi:hypothetical protein